MTRKKFIKQLGRYGITRNTANGMAEITRQRGGTYAHALAYFQLLVDEFNRRVKEALTDAILYGEGTTGPLGRCNYFPAYSPALDFEIKPKNEPWPSWYYTFGAMPLHPPVVKLRTNENPHLDGCSAKVHIVDEGAELQLHTHTNAPGTDPVTLRFGTAGGGGK